MTIHGPTYLYSGEGAWPVSVSHTQRMLETVLDGRGIKQVASLDAVDQKTRLVVIPGGHVVDIGLQSGISWGTKVASYVKEGGLFFGICAGGILGTKTLITRPPLIDIPENASITSLQRTGSIYREGRGHESAPGFLSFYPGRCLAPYIVRDMDPQHPSNACAVDVIADEGLPFKAFHYSGPAFLEASSEAKVLLKYRDLLLSQEVTGTLNPLRRAMVYSLTGKSIAPAIAALSSSFGKGRYVLTGIHPEIDPDTYEVPAELATSEAKSARQALVTRIFQELHLE
jgi:glutamine amidotransferase-like uncharacterized protein